MNTTALRVGRVKQWRRTPSSEWLIAGGDHDVNVVVAVRSSTVIADSRPALRCRSGLQRQVFRPLPSSRLPRTTWHAVRTHENQWFCSLSIFASTFRSSFVDWRRPIRDFALICDRLVAFSRRVVRGRNNAAAGGKNGNRGDGRGRDA